MKIPFNKPYISGNEINYVLDAHSRGMLAGDGFYTKKCHQWIEENLKTKKALLTHSGTGALEMMAILSNIEKGDEVIMPSFTFSSTANAVVLRGGVPVFVDIRSDTLNLDEKLIEKAITSRTKAIAPVHYAGVGCEMDEILEISKKHSLVVMEDAAQGFLSKYKGKYLGSIGDMGAISFHETKNVISGEGGSLLVNDEKLIDRAEIIREKGTNRSKFFRGQVDKYTWVDLGSSYLPGEIIAAFLLAQLERSREITKKRLKIWNLYYGGLEKLEKRGLVRRLIIPNSCDEYNGHMFYILLNDIDTRTKLIDFLKSKGILSVFHYVPLHSSPAGIRFGKSKDPLANTDRVSNTILRLPLFVGITQKDVEEIINLIEKFFEKK